MKKIILTTHNHIGDAVILTAVIENAKLSHPDFVFGYDGNYESVFTLNPYAKHIFRNDPEAETVFVEYAPFSQSLADGGSLIDGFTFNLGLVMRRLTGRGIDIVRTTPHIFLDENEASFRPCEKNYVVLCTSCQKCTEVKGYPHWKRIAELNPDITFVITGGAESRDINVDFCLENIVDMRGKTTARQLFAVIKNASAVISSPSSGVHIAAAFNVPCIEISGAREPIYLCDYDNVVHISSHCENYDRMHGCMKFYTTRCDSPKNCTHTVKIGKQWYSSCMCNITPEVVSEWLSRIL